jgi:hypothetical protein
MQKFIGIYESPPVVREVEAHLCIEGLCPVCQALENPASQPESLAEVIASLQTDLDDFFDRPRDSTEDGDFQPSSPLRAANDEDDTLGSEYDPGTIGTAEAWFRKFRGGNEGQL